MLTQRHRIGFLALFNYSSKVFYFSFLILQFLKSYLLFLLLCIYNYGILSYRIKNFRDESLNLCVLYTSFLVVLLIQEVYFLNLHSLYTYICDGNLNKVAMGL